MADQNGHVLTSKDFATDQEVRWCPGCGDYSILKQTQKILPDLGVPKENIVFISGIGCSSRFPYYMNTFGMHSIHGRAPSIASGLKATRPDLSVWIITGDGDSLSIGGNHLIHILRRNFDVNILLFNNEIYGLTKGQYSPTSPQGTINKTAPMGTIDQPFNPLELAMGANATYVARAMDRDPKHLQEMLKRAHAHKGASLLEIYQNCNVFNDGAFFSMTEKTTKADNTLFVEHGQPLIFGAEQNKGIWLDGLTPRVVELGSDYSADDLWVHDANDRNKAWLLTQMFEDPRLEESLPRPFGELFIGERTVYNEELQKQVTQAKAEKEADLQELLFGGNTWEVVNN